MFAFVYALDLSESVSSLISLCIYVAMGYGTTTLVTLCRLKHAWMAWIPLLRLYKLGEIADLHCARNEDRKTNLRGVLVVLSVLTGAVAFGAIVYAVIALFAFILAGMAEGSGAAGALASFLLSTWVLWLVLAGLALATLVVAVVAIHRICKLFDPAHATLYTVLSAFLLPIPVVLVLLAQKKPVFTDEPSAASGGAEEPYERIQL